MSKNKKRATVAAALALLVDRFPQVFANDLRPLKIGIDSDLITVLDGAIQPRVLGLALMLYCNSTVYLRNCKVGAERLDLDGNVAGIVTTAEAAHAINKLAGLRAKAKARKAAATATPQPPPVEVPSKKFSLADLKLAAQARKEAAS